MPKYVQEQLFIVPDIFGDHVSLIRGFIASELRGKRLDGEWPFIVMSEVLGVAASSIAQTLAICRGRILPDSEAFESETFVARMDPLTASSTDPFCFDINHDPNYELHGLDRINALAIDRLTVRALDMARVVVQEEELAALIGTG